MSEKSLLKAIKALVFLVVIGTPFFYFRYGVYPYTLAKILFFQAAVEILFFIWLALAISFPKYRPRLTPLSVSIAAFLSIAFIASVNGVDFIRSFWSTYELGIGLFALLHFVAFGLVVSSLFRELPWRKIFYGSLAASVAVDLIAYTQIYIPSLLLVENPTDRPGATFGNPTFMSEYLVLHVFLAIYLFLALFREAKISGGVDKPKLYFVTAAGIIDVATVFFAQTRGDILGMAAGLTILLFIFAFRPPQGAPGFLSSRKTYSVLLAVIFVSSAIFLITLNNPFWKHIPGLSRFQSISFSEGSNIYPRLAALRAGWRGFLEKPILGYGLENFTPIYDRYYDPGVLGATYEETHFDKPHNFLLEYADAGGIVLFLSLVSLFAAAVYETIKQKDGLWRAVFSAAITSYVISNSFFFETIGSLLMLYLFFGATDGAFRERAEEFANPASLPGGSGKVRGVLVGSCLAVALVPVYFINIQSLAASYYQYMGFTYFLGQNIISGLSSFNSSIDSWSPYNWNFKRDYAIAVAGQYFNYPGTVSDEDALKAIKAMEEVRDEHPEDAFNHYALVNLYNEVANIDKKTFTAKAESEAKTALEMSPNRQETYFYLAKTKAIEGDYSSALSILKHILDYSPNVPDAHFYYGVMAYATGDAADGYKEIKAAMDMGRQWVTFYEPRTVAGYFADSGHLEEAIGLYKIAWGMSGGTDLESEIKLGVAYFYDRQFDQAKQYLKDALSKLDITKSPSYGQLKPIFDQLGITP